ncbi:hypothetical protein HN832_03295 [archaeon]|jgi:hypothetical protein|nr:hypothetical protein [archaeon]MBT4373578.1 hypothetical protein [archaeon]MBT4532026.1 hypothetical protein [archaeon]MBT7001693.1 hypothetical protein [archaeon]MBT7282415.1 hypothetical protein [archaeon]
MRNVEEQKEAREYLAGIDFNDPKYNRAVLGTEPGVQVLDGESPSEVVRVGGGYEPGSRKAREEEIKR